MNDLTAFFGEPIHAYTRAQTLADGVLQHLPAKYRAALVLFYLEGVSCEEAARFARATCSRQRTSRGQRRQVRRRSFKFCKQASSMKCALSAGGGGHKRRSCASGEASRAWSSAPAW